MVNNCRCIHVSKVSDETKKFNTLLIIKKLKTTLIIKQFKNLKKQFSCISSIYSSLFSYIKISFLYNTETTLLEYGAIVFPQIRVQCSAR